MENSYDDIPNMTKVTTADLVESMLKVDHGESATFKKRAISQELTGKDNRNKSLGTITTLKKPPPEGKKRKKSKTVTKGLIMGAIRGLKAYRKGKKVHKEAKSTNNKSMLASTMGIAKGILREERRVVVVKRGTSSRGVKKSKNVLANSEVIAKGILSRLARGGLSRVGRKGAFRATRAVRGLGGKISGAGRRIGGASMARRGVIPTTGTRIGGAVERVGRALQRTTPGQVAGVATVGALGGATAARIASRRKKKRQQMTAMEGAHRPKQKKLRGSYEGYEEDRGNL